MGNTMHDEKLFRETAQKIIKSPVFGRSDTYANLLNFLVESTLSGNIPKETVIAEKIFGNRAFDPSESTLVRVYVFNLRKKLAKYYQGQTETSEWRLTIPKGSYEVVMQKPEVEKEEKPSSQPIRSGKKSWLLFVVLVISVLLNFFLWDKKKPTEASYKTIPESGLWTSFLSSTQPYYVVLGDLFIYSEYDREENVNRTIRVHNMNSLASYEKMATHATDTSLELSTLAYSFLVRNSAEWVKSLTQIFCSYQQRFSIRYVTKFGSKDLLDNNIIVVGMLKTFGLFNNYFTNSQFDLLPSDTLRYRADSLQTVRYYTPSGDPDSFHTDYGFIAKFPGPNNNTVLMCGGLWDTGASQSLKMLTDPILLKQLEDRLVEKFDTVPDYFEVLIEVNGIDRTELTSQILQVNQISHSQNLWKVK